MEKERDREITECFRTAAEVLANLTLLYKGHTPERGDREDIPLRPGGGAQGKNGGRRPLRQKST